MVALSECVGREPTEIAAQFATDLLLATWIVAFILAHRIFVRIR